MSLVLETVDEAGTPFRRTPQDFEVRAVGLLAQYEVARATHRRCARPHRRNEVLGTLVDALSTRAEDRHAKAARVRHRLNGFIAAYGAPGSGLHTRSRAAHPMGPSHAAIAKVIAERLEGEPTGDGIRDRGSILEPVLGAWIPERIARHVERAVEAPLGDLLARRAVRSAETMAKLLPQLSGPALASRFDDPRARTLYAASYRAFRQRRSLLLVWLQHQVRFTELPWIAALEAEADRDPSAIVRATLREVAALAITTFPGTQMPNKLVAELSTLAAQAGLGQDENGDARLPLIEEVAADIFMGTFSSKFLRAAKIAARMLGERSLYARYYGLPYERVLAIEKLVPQGNARTAPELDALCLELAALPTGGNPRARSGAMIEQASILTTHGLASLISVLDLEPVFADRYVALAEDALTCVLDRLERRVLPERVPKIQRMRAAKTLAFGWRQMLFFLSRAPKTDVEAFVIEARAMLAARSELARERFEPVMRGLEIVAAGETLSRGRTDAVRLYGWSVERPMLMGPATPSIPIGGR